jgi:hypothetical protein
LSLETDFARSLSTDSDLTLLGAGTVTGTLENNLSGSTKDKFTRFCPEKGTFPDSSDKSISRLLTEQAPEDADMKESSKDCSGLLWAPPDCSADG